MVKSSGEDVEQTFWKSWSPRVLSILRIVVALLFIEHGTQKWFGIPAGPGPVPLNSLIGAAAMIETIGGVLLLLGLLTRPVAFVMCGEMAVAYFMAHAPKSPFPVVNQGEPAILFCFIFLYYVFEGAGSWSLDALFVKEPVKPDVPSGYVGNQPVRGT
jgi:putative oxidoreductase